MSCKHRKLHKAGIPLPLLEGGSGWGRDLAELADPTVTTWTFQLPAVNSLEVLQLPSSPGSRAV